MKVFFELDNTQPTVGVKIVSGNDSSSFPITAETFASLFSSNYSTGYFFVSADGPIYIDERNGEKVVVVQRGMRIGESIRWGGAPLVVNTPWTYIVTRLKPSSSGMIRSFERIFVSNGPSIGALTPLFGAEFLGNVYPDNKICWGTVQTTRGETNLSSLVNLANDFFTQNFSADIERSSARWRAYSADGRIPTNRRGTLGEMVKLAWGER